MMIWKTLLALLLMVSPALATTTLYGSVVIEHDWGYNSSSTEETFNTGICNGTSVRVVESTAASAVQFLSCVEIDTPSRDCDNAGYVESEATSTTDHGLSHGREFLRVTLAVPQGGGGFGAAIIKCTKTGLLENQDLYTASFRSLETPPLPVFLGISQAFGGLVGVGDLTWYPPYLGVSGKTNDWFILMSIASDLNSPSVVGSLQDATNMDQANGVVFVDDVALVVSEINDSVFPIRITDPSVPAGGVALTNASFEDMKKCINYLPDPNFIVCSAVTSGSVTTINVTNPFVPILTGGMILTDASMLAPNDMVMENFTIFATGGNTDDAHRVMSINAADPALMVFQDFVTRSVAGDCLDNIQGVALSGDGLLYVASFGGDCVSIYDSTNPANLTLLGSVQNAELLTDVEEIIADGRWIYALSFARIVLIDARDPSAPTIVGSVDFSARMSLPTSMVRVGDRIYVGGTNANLLTFGINGVRDGN